MLIRYGRVFNLGNYETERIEMEDSIGDDETTEGAVERLRELVNNSATDRKESSSSSWPSALHRNNPVVQLDNGERLLEPPG